MSFTPVDGLPMGTRTGALDPGVILYLLQHGRMDAEAAQRLIYEQSGLLGISGLSGDMRTQPADEPAGTFGRWMLDNDNASLLDLLDRYFPSPSNCSSAAKASQAYMVAGPPPIIMATPSVSTTSARVPPALSASCTW